MLILYMGGGYAKKNPTWHVEESTCKAEQIARMLRECALTPRTICEVGCGAGEVLRQLQEHVTLACKLTGYDISPHAYELARSRANDRLHFKLADIREESDLYAVGRYKP